MNRYNARVVEAKIPAAQAITQRQFGRGKLTRKQARECEDITEWLQEQDDAEVDLLLAEISNRRQASGRRSLYS